MTLSVIIPALNEEKNILLVIDNTLSAFRRFGISGEIIVINDGSTDLTPQIVKRKMDEGQGVIRMISHDRPKGIGASFWDGVDAAKGNAVLLIPGDNENDPAEILRYHKLLEDVDMVVPFIFNKEIRSIFRNILSSLYRFIINTTFLVNFKYTNGTVIYRKSVLKELDYRSNGFFFQTDILIKLVKRGYLFAEVPCRLGKRKEGSSKLITLFSLLRVMKDYLCLVRNCYLKKNQIIKAQFSSDSLTAVRRNNKTL